jgi:L-amino acid N-acyltransferase YncA
VRRIVSGGQTGVDRAALDVAEALELDRGGWVPRGRRAEDGPIPDGYTGLIETESPNPAIRTERNVRDSDATLIVTLGEPTGGTLLTLQIARRLERPVLHVDLEVLAPGEAVARVRSWLAGIRPGTLNVAGPRESGRPGAYAAAAGLLTESLSPCSIRAVREDDAPAIVDLLNPIIEAGTFTVLDRPVTVEDQLEFIRSLPPRSVYHVAVATGGAVAGIQDVLPHGPHKALAHVGEISTFVALERGGAGVGRTLTAATVRAARALGYRKLLATIRADNPGAVSFYEGRGFRRVALLRAHALVGGRFLDEVVAERTLAGGSPVPEGTP